jgi:tRNA G46 methylase TrmB
MIWGRRWPFLRSSRQLSVRANLASLKARSVSRPQTGSERPNKAANAKTVALLGEVAGDQVLEIGFGNGRIAPHVIGQAADVRNTGIDISPTMVAEASRFNAADRRRQGQPSPELGRTHAVQRSHLRSYLLR